MERLERHEFTCAFCYKERVTFVTRSKLEESMRRSRPIQEIFNPQFFPSTYREIFVSKMCGECNKQKFGDNPRDVILDVDINENDSELEARITTMYEDARE